MKLSIQSDDGTRSEVVLGGQITQRDVSPFQEPLGDALGPDAYKRRVMVDMQDVEMLDSSGVGWLLVCNKRFKEGGGALVLHSFSPTVSNVLKVLNMHQVLPMADDEQHARQLLDGDPQ